VNQFGRAATQYNRVVFGLLVLLAVLVAGTAGYMVIEDWSLLDAAYMASITITTVGYSEVRPLSDAGKIFTVGLMFIGVGTAFYILTALVATIIEGDLRQVFGARRMKVMIERLQGHYIVCGYGRVGEQVARELDNRHASLVIIDRDEARLNAAREAGLLVVQGDATVEETLASAGIDRCHALIAASDSDATNTYITLTAKSLRPETYVVARVGSTAVEPKLIQAGADRVVSPYQISGRRLAFAALQPDITDFIDIFPSDPQGERILAEITVESDSSCAGKQLGEALANSGDVVVLAVRDTEGRLNVGPSRSRVLMPGEILIVMGEEADVGTIGSGGAGRHAGHARDRGVLEGLRRFLHHD
jgi:voltage-gated potassium channel